VYEETLTGQPHDTLVQKATICDNKNVDAVQRHDQDVPVKYYISLAYIVQC